MARSRRDIHDPGRSNRSGHIVTVFGYFMGYSLDIWNSWSFDWLFFWRSSDAKPVDAISYIYYGYEPLDDTDPFAPFQPPLPVVPLSNNETNEILSVQKINFHIGENCRLHHTSEFDITQSDDTPNPQLVVRRGQSFDITVTFNRPYDKSKDDLRLVFQAGKAPIESKKTHVELVLSEKVSNQWANVVEQDGSTLRISILTPSNCYIAKWKLKIDVVTKTDGATTIYRYNHRDPIYILFNPWCKDDTVYFGKDIELGEYIMKDTGRIYGGTANNISAKPWNFGQFEDHVLDCAMYILDISELKWPVRGNPINIIRQLTALVNAPDDGGVVVGNWSGDYTGGKSPLTWTGSAPILQEFYIIKQPVKFGQCWVFSGVLTTVCRALGIPARCVTNFSSAHDTDGSVSIDIHFDANGEVDKSLTDDSIWNFHVWNEVWMARPDLPPGYGGWQAVDSTPQETSDGVFCCGPASLVAVKRGELGQLYDVPFVFAEVNADIIHWHLRDGSMVNEDIRKNHVGKKISTKFPLYDQRQDITQFYKHKEDSHEERAAVINAHKQLGVTVRKSIYDIGPDDVECELIVKDDVFVGEDFDVVLQVTNTSSADRIVGGQLAAKTMFYTGVEANRVKTELFEEIVQPEKSMEKTMRITFDEYRLKLKDMCMLKLSAMVKVQDTKQVFTTQKVIKLSKPSLTIKIPTEIKKGKSFDVEISFTNPLDESLTNCFLEVEGPGLQKRQQHRLGNIDPRKVFETKFEMTPRKLGERELVIIFYSDQLEDINATQVVDVID
ncbi:hypothetical protein SNE40_017972 [Patella caerulea]